MTPYREFSIADTYLRAGVAAVCAYEVVAITTHKVPTVSWLVRRYPQLGPIVLTALALHFQPTPLQICTDSPSHRREGP